LARKQAFESIRVSKVEAEMMVTAEFALLVAGGDVYLY
jgi:hypothetical protein